MIRPASERTKALRDLPWFWWFKDTDIDLADDSLSVRQKIVDRLWELYVQMDGYRYDTRRCICTGRPTPHLLFDAIEHSALYCWWKEERDELDELKSVQDAA